MEQIWSVAEEAMEREGLDPSAVCGLASIDLKSGEPGLCSLCLLYTSIRLVNNAMSWEKRTVSGAL